MSSTAPTVITAPVLEKFLHQKIPLTVAMGVRVADTNSRYLVLEAPLDKNVNHLGTAFGGSLHTLPTLACYAVAWMLLREAGLDGHVVIKHSEADYRQPVTSDLRAVCERPAPETGAAFIAAMRRYKKARIELRSTIFGPDDKPAVDFHGHFVAVL